MIQERIGLLFSNRVNFYKAFVGCLLSNNIATPLRPQDSMERLELLTESYDIKFILTEEHFVSKLPAEILNNNSYAVIEKLKEENDSVFTADDIEWMENPDIYTIFTSGSTGVPKGVTVNNRNLKHLFDWLKREFDLSEQTRSYQLLSTNFDFGIKEIFNVFMNGGSMVASSSTEMFDPEKILEEINFTKPNMLYTTPSIFKELLNLNKSMKTLELICFGGEILEGNLLLESKHLLNENIKIYNGYGPTEASINVLMHLCTQDDSEKSNLSVPLGKESGRNKVFIFGKNDEFAPPGKDGEIVIFGPGVTNDDINSSFIKKEIDSYNYRGYKTGDIGYINSKQEVIYKARKDHQVKIRGYRVNLKEIELAINQLPEVSNSIVSFDESLTAYIKAKTSGNLSIGDIKSKLLRILPNYMIPNKIIQVEEIELNNNGKAIPHFKWKNKSSNKVAKNKVEEVTFKIMNCWNTVLKQEIDAVDDNFFEIGGHSLNAIKLLNLLKEIFSVDIDIVDIYSNVTVDEQRKLILTQLEGEGKNEE